jgi:hypothetical protein
VLLHGEDFVGAGNVRRLGTVLGAGSGSPEAAGMAEIRLTEEEELDSRERIRITGASGLGFGEKHIL